MEIKVKRVYEEPADGDGLRVLVDRLWPRGVSRPKAKIDLWLKDIAPSNELRSWYGHDPEKWPEFRTRYFAELDSRPESVEELIGHARSGTVTLLYSSREQRLNNAHALKEYLQARAR
ncbi:MAG: DUF488 family protein [Bacteriovoracaceae bacterium]|jgi:uncharacterized protein YeaO (DUF488 family)|nr:DUF488 family protein [Deltaproteobacteria bacterium]MDI9541288.1 DUF488 family protein [Pseudomonadota bacterium]NLW66780.1 DUF488 family protein [Bacteriovoracaceae bacterium]HRR20757.1 DUF488 family protein [Desulfomonilia bacterium]HNR50495.1 DUF488 family protein [Deltaproteobacteria bacterium]